VRTSVTQRKQQSFSYLNISIDSIENYAYRKVCGKLGEENLEITEIKK